MLLPRKSLRLVFVAFCMLPLLAFFAPALAGQEKLAPGNPNSTSAPANSAGQEAHPATDEASQKNGEGNNEGASQEEAIRHSSAVHFIARITGLSDDQAYWLSVIINFGVVLFFIVYFARKKLPGLFRSRTDAIQKHLEEARKTSEEARGRLKEVEARLARLDEEIAAMRREAAENARTEDERVESEVEEERRRIVASAEQEIAMAADAARRDLQGYAVELAVDLASKRIHVGPESDQVLVRDFTSLLGKDGH